MDVAYNLLAQYPNAGEAFTNAFQQGMQGSAINALMQNPDDPNALAAYAKYDPKAALEYSLQQRKENLTAKQQQTELDAKRLQDWHKYAGELAKWADTPDKWDQAVDYLVQSGHPEAAQLKGQFSPAVRAQFMALGGIEDDKPQIITPQPGGGAFQYNPNGPPIPLVLPNDGSQQTGAPAAQMPTVATPEDAAKLPPGTQFRMPDGRIGTVPGGNGGQTAVAPSGGFRR
jgi:hypothetical protein